MGWFGVIGTSILFCAICIFVVYLIFNLIYKIADSCKVNSVIAFIVSIIMFIVLLTDKNGPQVRDGEFATSTTGVIAAAAFVLAFPMSNLMVLSHDGDEVFSGIGQAIFSCGGFLLISVIILCFSDTYWPLIVLTGAGALFSVIAFFKE
jgi:hypothetical protein